MATEEATTGSAVLEAIHNRRSPTKFRPERPPQELIEQLLEAAIRAPNHYLNEPWRFFVVAGEARQRLGDVFAEIARGKLADPTTPQGRSALERERQKPQRAPVIIAVATVRTEQAHALEIEDIEATAAENILLAAPALGLGAYWRTGDAAYDPRIKEFFGLRPQDHLDAFLYVGYPETWGPVTPRTGVADKTTWLGWE